MTAQDVLMAEDVAPPDVMLGDKGYDSDAIREDLERRSIESVIPTKSNRKVQRAIDKGTYAMRNRIERFFNKIKHSRRVATRYDKLASSFPASSNSQPSDADQVCPHDLSRRILVQVASEFQRPCLHFGDEVCDLGRNHLLEE